jgi:peptidyl-tRNA hydrolase, PTH1 family
LDNIILGLGNSGSNYSTTRHNFGFLAAEQFRVNNNFPEFHLEKKFHAEISINEFAKKKVILARPQTFINLSGEAARAILNFYKILPENLFVIFDDLDLKFGKIRFRENGNSGGHRGVENLIQNLGTKNFSRLKLGIANEFSQNYPAENFVLTKFSTAERKKLPEILDITNKAIVEFLQNGFESAANNFNGL